MDIRSNLKIRLNTYKNFLQKFSSQLTISISKRTASLILSQVNPIYKIAAILLLGFELEDEAGLGPPLDLPKP